MFVLIVSGLLDSTWSGCLLSNNKQMCLQSLPGQRLSNYQVEL